MRHRLAAAGIAVLLLGAGGCGGDPEPRYADPTSEVPTTSTSAPTSSPASPSTEPAAESARDFLIRWQELSDRMQLTGETADFLALGPDCAPCADTAAIVDKYYGAGGYIRFEGTKVRRVSRVGKTDDVEEFDLVRDTAPTTYRERAGGPVKSFAGGRSTFRVSITQTDGAWVVVDYVQQAS